MDRQSSDRKRQRRRPPSPPASLVRLLQQDKKVLTYFESLQEALAADVQIWKDRARTAEAALQRQQPNDKKNAIQEEREQSQEPTSSIGRSHRHDASSKPSKHDDRTRKEPPNTSTEPPNSTEPAARTEDCTDDMIGVPIDDDFLDFDNLSSSSSSSSSSIDEPSGKAVLPVQANKNAPDDGFLEQSEEESSQIASLLAESLGVFAEFGVVLTVQPTNNSPEEATATTKSGKGETTDSSKATTTADETKDPATSANIATVTATAAAASMIVGPKQRADHEVVADLVELLRRSNTPLDEQARIFRALVLFDSFHDRHTIIDRLLERLGHGQWKVWLHLWRNDLPSASVVALSFILHSIENDNVPRMQDLAAALFPPETISLLSTGERPWLEQYISTQFGDDFLSYRAILKIAFDFLRDRTEEAQPQAGGDDEDNARELQAVKHIESSFGCTPTDDEHPDVEELLAAMRKSCPTMNATMENQAMKIWQILMKILLVTLEKESVVPDFRPDNEEEWDIVIYMQRFRFMDAIRQHEPINAFPAVDSSWKTRSLDDPLRLCRIIECASLLADGQDFIDYGHALLRQTLNDEPLGVIQCLRNSIDFVLVRVINLEQRKDRMISFICQCMREGLLCIKGVTPFDPSSAAEYGSFAYDGRGRLIEANNRLESFMPGGVTELDKTVASHWIPNNLKPFDRDAPATERSARISPSERACALSHVACWRGIQRSLTLDPNNDSPSHWVRNLGHMHRLFNISGFASGAALLAENSGLPPAPVCVVLEDDAMLVEGFAQKLADLLEGLPRDFHFCSLGYSRPKSAPIIPLPGTLVGVPSMLWYLTGYCLSCRGADYLLESLPVVGPVDSWIGLKMAHENWDNTWGMTIGIGAHAQPESLPKRKDLAEIIKFHAYCALKPLCSQKVRVDATRTAGSVMAAPGTGRNWRQRDTDVEYSGHILYSK
jgi:hypothetical protein